MELYKVATVNFELYDDKFSEDFMEFLINNKNFLYYKKRNKIIIYGMIKNGTDKYPTEEELTEMVDNYINKYLNPNDLSVKLKNEFAKEELKDIIDKYTDKYYFDTILPENEANKGVSISTVNKIENPNNEEE